MNRLKLFAVLLVGIAIAGCKSVSPYEPESLLFVAAAAQAQTLGLAQNDLAIDPTGPDVPNNGRCPNCNGRGKIGDGTVMMTCPVCGGSGKVSKRTFDALLEQRLNDLMRSVQTEKANAPYQHRGQWFVKRNGKEYQWDGQVWRCCVNGACDFLSPENQAGSGGAGHSPFPAPPLSPAARSGR